MRRPRRATTRASRLFIVPEATLRGFAYGSSSRSSRSRLMASNRARGRKTSPLTSSRRGTPSPLSVRGTDLIARTFGVTSSPRTPSPRVTPRTSRPSS